MSGIHKLVLIIAAAAVIACGTAWAHNVVVFAWVEGDMVHVEGKFGSGRKVVNAPVEVYDSKENLLLAGVTDENGEFIFKAPEKAEMKVVLLAGMGHRGEWTISAFDFETDGPGEGGEAEVSGARRIVAFESEPETERVAVTGSSRAPSEYVTVAVMQAAIEETLDKKLKPMMKLLVDAKQSGPSITDVLGGIGYIFGLAGVAAYVASRRHKK